MKKYTLTDEHRAQLKPWADKWIANAMSTKPMDDEDRAATTRAVRGLYEAAGLQPPPRIVFVPSPFVLRFAGGFAAGIWHLRHAATYAATAAATDAATRAATDAATYAATRDATYAATRAATDDATADAWYGHGIAAEKIAACFGPPKFLLDCAAMAYRLWQGGNQWSAWDSFLSFFRHIAKLPLDYSKWDHWEQASLHSGPRIMHQEFCMISDRPELLTVDAENRPHNDSGPFCRWRDGSALYAWHGVRVPRWIIEHPEKITVEKIEAEQNQEVRRVMVQRYGQARYIQDSGAELVHEDDFGQLYRKCRPEDTDLVMVKVVNSTPEPDGSFKDYWLRVHPELRPLNAPGAKPQAMTARNAVASTFGLRGEAYQPAVET